MSEKIQHDIIILGGGAAGLRAALEIAENYKNLSVAVVSKVYPIRSHTVAAEGGIAGVLKENDNFESHAWDTIKGGDFLSDQDAVELFVEKAAEEVIRLEHWGCPWSREKTGKLAVRAFGGMSVKRTVFAADKTGFFMLHSLFERTLKYPNIIRYDEWFATSIITENNRVHGLVAFNIKNNEISILRAKAVIMATGGAGKVYQFTTNANINTGDGYAMAYRAGAFLKDMEFVQFHPTALPRTGILITEGVRGEGAYLVNKDGERFLKNYIPEKMELGPRDLVSRAIIKEIDEGRGVKGPYGDHVYLDLKHLGEELINKKLPQSRQFAKHFIGIDPVSEPIPVRPAVHYFMGGIHTNIFGKTNLDGLFAAGECACVNINGANRLGSNSLAECLVFGSIAGKNAAEYALKNNFAEISSSHLEIEEKRIFDGILKNEHGDNRIADLRSEMQYTMETGVGILRNEKNLVETINQIRKLKMKFQNVRVEDKGKKFNTDLIAALELDLMLDVAEIIAVSALKRTESRGSHYRTDYPTRNDKDFLAHSLSKKSKTGPSISYIPVKITKWQPQERKY